MKKTKILVPAMGMLLLSTAASVTGTVAWFSANNAVTAQGMQLKAKAQDGLVISNAAAGTYNETADSSKTTCAELIPASTWNLSTWLTSKSTDPSAANTEQAYVATSAWVDNSAEYGYVVHNFYIRSSSASALTVTGLDVTKVEAKVSGGAAAQNLSKALRVGVLFDGSTNPYIYAPVTGYTASYTVQKAAGAYSNAEGARATVAPLAYNTRSHDTTVTSIPASTSNGLHVEVFIWFEGEDAACISNNIQATMETLDVTVEFALPAA